MAKKQTKLAAAAKAAGASRKDGELTRDQQIAALIRGEIRKQEKLSGLRSLTGSDTATIYRIAGLRMALAFVDPKPHE